MATQSIFVFLFVATLAFAMVAESSLSSHFNDPAVGAFVRTSRIGDTLFEHEEKMMSSESARRALSDNDHISFMAMAQNAIPCKNRGASYYECNQMQKVKPYRRGCSKITECKAR